jgi:hypothetical protein
VIDGSYARFSVTERRLRNRQKGKNGYGGHDQICWID